MFLWSRRSCFCGCVVLPGAAPSKSSIPTPPPTEAKFSSRKFPSAPGGSSGSPDAEGSFLERFVGHLHTTPPHDADVPCEDRHASCVRFHPDLRQVSPPEGRGGGVRTRTWSQVGLYGFPGPQEKGGGGSARVSFLESLGGGGLEGVVAGVGGGAGGG